MTRKKVIKIVPDELTAEEKCSYCTNTTCCTYITQELDTPRSMEEFDTLLWQLSHEGVQLYKEDGSWYLLVNNRCRHIQPSGRCAIYAVRPQICRQHDNSDCEFNSPAGEEDFDLFFADDVALDAWCRKRFKSWDRRWERFARKAK